MTALENALLEVFFKMGIDRFASSSVEKLPVIIERHMPPGTRNVVLFLMPYHVAGEKRRNISRYAVSRDYHLCFSELDRRVSDSFKRTDIKCFAKVMGDLSPIDEKSAALSLGLGVRGKNRLLINDKYGSYIFIGAVYTDADISVFSDGLVSPGGECVGCGRCERACPTYLSGNGECLSAITQKKRLAPDEEKLLAKYAKSCIWGCDICQECCPYNADIPDTPIRFFYEKRLPYVTAEILNSMSDDDFAERAYAWRGRKVIERNAALRSADLPKRIE